MQIYVENEYDYICELRARPEIESVPLSSDSCTPDVGQLVDEVFTHAVLREVLPPDCKVLHVSVRPIWSEEPLVDKISVTLTADEGPSFTQEFATGRWARTAQAKLIQLREEGTLEANEQAYRLLIALPNQDAHLDIPALQPPWIEDATLADCGIQRLGEGTLSPERPVLVNQRFESDAIVQCIDSDAIETGGAALGRLVRLPEPLPGTKTRVVTILSTIVNDPRHVGTETRFQFHPEALAAAQQVCELRGLKEQVMTVYHTHGWSGRCGNCNQSATCPLTESNPSLHDYEQLLEQLFPAKSCLLPIAGRKLGAEGRRPVLQIHAWSLGEMRPISWQTYED